MKPAFPGTPSKRGVIIGGLVLALLITGLTAWLTIDLRDRAIAWRKQELARFATVVAEAAERALQAIDLAQRSVVEDLRQHGVATDADLLNYGGTLAINTMLRQRIAELPQGEALTIADSKGDLLNTSRAWPFNNFNIADRVHFKRLKDEPSVDGFLSPLLINRYTNKPTVFIVRRITAPDGHFLGGVYGAVNLPYFEELYRSILPEGQNSIVLSMRDGTALARYPPAPEFVGKILPALVMGDEQQRVMTAISPIDGLLRFAAIHALTHFPVVVTVAIQSTAALQAWREEAILHVSAALLLDLAIAAGVALLLRQMRIQAQAAQAARLEAANDARRDRERSAGDIRGAAERAAILSNLAGAFDRQVGQMSRAVADAAGHVQAGAASVSALAEDATHRTQDAAVKAASGAAEVSATAIATEALTSSIENVAREALRGAALVRVAASAAHDADATVATLTSSAAHIGQIVNLISGIAQQTNLLALNATIEAARAGDAGRGFAVVASEVKNLSKAVSHATEDIKRQIDGMQAATSQTAAAMRQIREFVTTINTIASDITRAMEHQRSATLQIAGTMVNAAGGARNLSEHIGDASRAVTQTGTTAASVRAVAHHLADQADALRVASEQFLARVHAA